MKRNNAMKKRKLKQKKKHYASSKRRQLKNRILNVTPVESAVKEIRSAEEGSNRVYIFESELDFIHRCIKERPNIETGGQMYGYITANGDYVIHYALGPGPKANHQVTFFNQDLEYLKSKGHELNNVFGLNHIGEWHSHHQLGLPRPSGHDAQNMISTIRERGLGAFLLCIGTFDGRNAHLNPFHCDAESYRPAKLEVIPSKSPIRLLEGRMVSGDNSNKGIWRVNHDEETSSKPTYADGYWLKEKSANIDLKKIHSFLSHQPVGRDGLRISLDGKGLVHIFSSYTVGVGNTFEEEIIFPQGFPAAAPQVKRWYCGSIYPNNHVTWIFTGDIYDSFVNYYSKL